MRLSALTTRKDFTETFNLAIPLAATQLASISISTTDTVMLGWLGPDELAGGSLSFRLYIICFLACLGVILAVGPILTQELGRRNYRNVRRTVRQGFWVVAATATPISVILWNAEDVMIALGQPEGMSQVAGTYLRWSMWGLAPSLFFIVLRQFVSAHERPRAPLVALVCTIPLNALGNWLLMYGYWGLPEMGLKGVGLATSLTHLLMFTGMLIYCQIDRKFRRYMILLRFWRPDWPRFREIFQVGYPIALATMAESGLFAMSAILIGIIEPEAMAAHGIAMQCSAVAFMVPLGFSQAATVRAALAVGRDDKQGVRRACMSAMLLAIMWSVFPITVFAGFGETVTGFYLDLDDPAVQPVVIQALIFLALVSIFCSFDGLQVVIQGSLRGLKDTQIPMRLTIIAYWGAGVWTSFVLGKYADLGATGIWYGILVGLAVSAALQGWRMKQILKRDYGD